MSFNIHIILLDKESQIHSSRSPLYEIKYFGHCYVHVCNYLHINNFVTKYYVN